MLKILRNKSDKLLRFASVSLVVVPITQLLLLLFYSVVGLPGVAANALAVSLASVPGYLLNRRWVWQKIDAHSLSREVLPFWVMNLVGLVLSTVVVGLVASQVENGLVLVAANIATFGALWLAKFAAIDRWLFAEAAPQ